MSKYLCTWGFVRHLALPPRCWWWLLDIWLVQLRGSAGQSLLGKEATSHKRWKQSSGKHYLQYHQKASFEVLFLPFGYWKCTRQVHVGALNSQQITTEGRAVGSNKINNCPNYLYFSSLTTSSSAKGNQTQSCGQCDFVFSRHGQTSWGKC